MASSAELVSLGPATLVVRPEPSPQIGLFGSLAAEEWRWLSQQARYLSVSCGTVRYIDYARAERLTDGLATAVASAVGEPGLESWGFAGIPRGGLLVLAMLAYRLGLEREQLVAGPDWEGPLVVVDDCALGGTRFRQFLSACSSSDVVFAHLCSVPTLRRRIVEREPRVRACVAALELEDCGPRLLGDEYEEWRERQRERLGGDRYWVGCPEAVGFSWSEPDRLLWDPDRSDLRLAWNLLPPERCLQHGAPSLEVQVQRESASGWTVAPNVLVAELEGRTLVGELESGAVTELSEVAAAMWSELLSAATQGAALEGLSMRFDAPRARLAEDLASLTRDLVARGLLIEV